MTPGPQSIEQYAESHGQQTDLLREALEYVGAGELERDYLWQGMRQWHHKVSSLYGIEPEAWADFTLD